MQTVGFLGKPEIPNSPVLRALGPQPHRASGDLPCLKHRRSIDCQDSRWLIPSLKDNENNFRHSCNFQSAFFTILNSHRKGKDNHHFTGVDSILKCPVQTPDNRSRKEYYIKKQQGSSLVLRHGMLHCDH